MIRWLIRHEKEFTRWTMRGNLLYMIVIESFNALKWYLGVRGDPYLTWLLVPQLSFMFIQMWIGSLVLAHLFGQADTYRSLAVKTNCRVYEIPGIAPILVRPDDPGATK